MIRTLSKSRLSVPLPQWEKIVPKNISKIFLKNKRRLKSHRAVVPQRSETIKLRNNFERSPLKFDSLYEGSPTRNKEKLITFRAYNRTCPLPDDSPIRAKSADRKLNMTRPEIYNYNYEKEFNESFEREVSGFKKIINKGLRELKGKEEPLLTNKEKEHFVKSFTELRPKMYTMTKGGSNYRRFLLKKKFGNIRTELDNS
ncbi:unnamed protein product [Blepharisma stoltei]|uniref:Uncharacterized protein n=1 Tax=Blepharisma stoltei TaxID=1481888 RepID=A0AAU9K7U7_9CILI|nr:unnamed protein product [Blepharisma stoltei]